jgi:23S rRNA (cytidine1920-2'-O)/16S rRNA (cytidine1409-2'-O)-methyltransferase
VQRLDQVLVDRGLCESRAKAQRLIMAGQVRINGHPAKKASDPVREGDAVELLSGDRYVSRGGHKLEHALVHFTIPVVGVTALDLGASTGGFTDCLLQHGASRVVAVDVGHGQLAWKLRQDPRVVVMERTNARHLTVESFAAGLAPFDLIVADKKTNSEGLQLADLTERPIGLSVIRPEQPNKAAKVLETKF